MKVQLVNILAAVVIGFLIVGLAASSNAAIIAEFTGGTGTDAVDKYLGAAGSGWATAWQEATTNDTTTPTPLPYTQTATVSSVTPLTLGGGNYLKVNGSNNGTLAGNNGFTVVRRQFGTLGEVDISAPYVVSFDYRPDVAFSGSSAFERYSILGSIAGGAGTSPNNTWIAVAYSGTGGTDNPLGHTATEARNWGFLHNTSTIDGSEPSMAAMTFVDSGIDLVAGTVYHFEIEVDPVNKQYKPSVSDGTNSFTSSTFLNFRNEDAGALTASWLHFNLGLLRGNLTSADLGYSVDNILISVPEPNAFYLITIGMTGLVALRKRRKAACRQ